MGFIIWILIGAIAGWLAGQIMKGRGFGLIGNILVGIVGGIIGGFLLPIIGFESTNWIGDIISAVIGAVVLLLIIGLVKR